jgi:hypothetical protein
MSLSFRLATPADADACNAFQERWLKRPRTAEQWRWEFANYHAKPILYALAIDGDEIVGSQALIRFPLRMPDGSVVQTGKGEDTLLHPRFWGKDLLRPLWDLLVEQAAASGIRMLWGFNARRPVFEKIGFRYLDEDKATLFLRPLSRDGLRRIALFDRHGNRKPAHRATWRHRIAAHPVLGAGATWATAARAGVARVAAVLSPHRHASVREVAAPSPSIEALLGRFASGFNAITVDRNAEFVRWRLQQNPWSASRLIEAYRGDELVGFAGFCLSADRQGMVTDIIACAPDTQPHVDVATTFDLLAHATAALAKDGAELVRFPIINWHALADASAAAARMLGYVAVQSRNGACIMPIDGAPLDEGLLRHERWHFTNINTEGREG